MSLLVPVYTLLVSALILAELKNSRRSQALFKPLAALGFCLIAVWAGALSTVYGQLILAALIFCAVGDIALLSRKSEAFFKIGMAAFAIGHVIYTVSFFHLGINMTWVIPSLLITGGVNFLMFRYLRKHMPANMIGPVLVYMMIITTMVVTAWGTKNGLIITAAMMFAISDMFVARDRFVVQQPRHALIISPLYFGAQALFAMNIALM